MTTQTLSGKVALVTGGSRGIGAGIAVEFAKRGVKAIAITYHKDLPSAEKVLSTIKSHGVNAIAIQADVLDPAFGDKVVAATLSGLKTDTISILVNNAAQTDFRSVKPIAAVDLDIFQEVFKGNLFSVINCTLAALSHLPVSGGRIINISSADGQEGAADPTMIYGASKAALNHVTRSLAKRYSNEKRCTINSVSVGPTETDSIRAVFSVLPEEVMEMIKGFAIERRLATVDDIAQVVAFLASEESRWINGNLVPASGGFRW